MLNDETKKRIIDAAKMLDTMDAVVFIAGYKVADGSRSLTFIDGDDKELYEYLLKSFSVIDPVVFRVFARAVTTHAEGMLGEKRLKSLRKGYDEWKNKETS